MPDRKDLNPDISAEIKSEINSQDLNDIEKLLLEEDPDFLKQISEIKITATGINLSVMDEVISAVTYPHLNFLNQFKSLFMYSANPRAVIIFWLSFFLTGAVIFFIWTNNKNVFSQKLFLTSLSDFSDGVHDYNPLDEVEDFYENPRFSKNLMTLSKMFVNIRQSENSGPTPMLALELNVEGLSSDAIIEIKDREAEFKDLLLRYIEEKKYDELITTSGKKEMLEQFQRIINSHLTRGQVRRVLLNSFIIKP